MIDVKRKQLQVPVTNKMLFKMIKNLKKDYKSLLTDLREDFCKKFNIDFTSYKDTGVFSSPVFQKLTGTDKLWGGDIFIGEKSEHYCLQISHDRKCIDVICVSRISDIDKNFDKFCEIITQAIFPMVKSAQLTWKNVRTINDKYRLLSRDFTVFSPNEEDYRAVTELESTKSRELLSKIKSKPNIFLNELADENERMMVGGLIWKMEQLGLVSRDYIVFCQQTGNRINRVDSISAIEDAAQQGFKCFHCGRLISNERIEQCISITEYGTYVTRGSYWLAVRLLGILKGAGLMGEDILVDYHEGEIDIIDLYFNCDNNLIISEIKSDIYSMSDAYLFWNKAVIYKPDSAMIISTNPISSGIKDYFKQVLPDLKIIYIDNINELGKIIDLFLGGKREEYVYSIFNNFESFTYVDLSPLSVANFFGVEEQRTDEKEIEELIKIKPEEEELISIDNEPEEESIKEMPEISDIPDISDIGDLSGISDIPDISEDILDIPKIDEIEEDLEIGSPTVEVGDLSGEINIPDMEDGFDDNIIEMPSMGSSVMDEDDFTFAEAMDFLGEGLEGFNIDISSLDDDMSIEETSMDIHRSLTSQEVVERFVRDGVLGRSIDELNSFLNPIHEIEGVSASAVANNEGLLICHNSQEQRNAEFLGALSVELDRRLSLSVKNMAISKPSGIAVEASNGKMLVSITSDFVLGTLIDEKSQDDEVQFDKRLNEFLDKFETDKEKKEYVLKGLLELVGRNDGVIGSLIGSSEGLLVMSSLPSQFSSEDWIAYMYYVYQASEKAVCRLNLGDMERCIFKSQINGEDCNIICMKNGHFIVGGVVSDKIPVHSVLADFKATAQACTNLLGL